MGYTHYWKRQMEFDRKQFARVVADVRVVARHLPELGVTLAGPDGAGVPEIDGEVIAFNGVRRCGHPSHGLGIAWPAEDATGVAADGADDPTGRWFAGRLLGARMCSGDCSHESFVLSRTAEGERFDFCKTAYKPYDLAVTAALVIAKHHLGDGIRVSSDGTLDHWRDAMQLCEEVLGYGRRFGLDSG